MKKITGNHLHFYTHDSGYEYVSRAKSSQGVIIVAATDKNKIVLVEQYRLPLDKMVIELPAGLVGDTTENANKSVEATAKRELLEETSYTCESIEEICTGPLLPGSTDEINSMYWAKGLKSDLVKDNNAVDEVYQHEIKHGIIEEGEEISVYEVPLDHALTWLSVQKEKYNKEIDMKVYLGLYFLKSKLKA